MTNIILLLFIFVQLTDITQMQHHIKILNLYYKGQEPN